MFISLLPSVGVSTRTYFEARIFIRLSDLLKKKKKDTHREILSFTFA